jgi:multidrug efflux pump subunit AcrA (membrane-fusion protein)
VIQKTLLIVLLAALAAISTEVLSQTPAGSSTATAKGEAAPKWSNAPPVTKKASPTANPASPKADNNKAEGKAPTSKDATPSKTFPTSSQAQASPGSASNRRELVIPRCQVTLIDDNKVPATEAGMLIGELAKEGVSVDKDALVAQIDNRSTLAKQRIAEGEFAAATASAENDAEVEVAEKSVEVSLAEWEQHKDIVKQNPRAVPLTELRKLEFTYHKSLAQVKQAKNEKNIAGLTANAKKAQYDAASIELDLREIRAPFKGQVVEVMKHVGDWVTVGEPIMHIVGLDRVKVRGFVHVTGEMGASHDEVLGKPVTITVYSAGDRQHTVKGIIGFASPVIEGLGSNRQFRIWAEVDNEKTIDPVTKQETWKIQPGSEASMTIDLTPPRAAAPPRSEPKSDKSKVQSFKPVTGETEKSDAKAKKSTSRER